MIQCGKNLRMMSYSFFKKTTHTHTHTHSYVIVQPATFNTSISYTWISLYPTLSSEYILQHYYGSLAFRHKNQLYKLQLLPTVKKYKRPQRPKIRLCSKRQTLEKERAVTFIFYCHQSYKEPFGGLRSFSKGWRGRRPS